MRRHERAAPTGCRVAAPPAGARRGDPPARRRRLRPARRRVLGRPGGGGQRAGRLHGEPRWRRRSRRSTSSRTSPSRRRPRSSSTRATPPRRTTSAPAGRPPPRPSTRARSWRTPVPTSRCWCPACRSRRRRPGPFRPPASTRRRRTRARTISPGCPWTPPAPPTGTRPAPPSATAPPPPAPTEPAPTQTAPSGPGNPLASSSTIIGVGALSATSSSQAPSTSANAVASATVGGISILGGFITIGSITSTANATSDGTTGKVTGSTLVQNMDIAGEQVTVDADGISAAGKNSPLSLPIASVNKLLNELGISIAVTNADGQGQRPLGQPDARRPQDHHRPQDARRRGEPVRLAPARQAHLAAPGRAARRPAADPGPGHGAGELDRLPRLRGRQQRQHRGGRDAGSAADAGGGRQPRVHRQLGRRVLQRHEHRRRELVLAHRHDRLVRPGRLGRRRPGRLGRGPDRVDAGPPSRGSGRPSSYSGSWRPAPWPTPTSAPTTPASCSVPPARTATR